MHQTVNNCNGHRCPTQRDVGKGWDREKREGELLTMRVSWLPTSPRGMLSGSLMRWLSLAGGRYSGLVKLGSLPAQSEND